MSCWLREGRGSEGRGSSAGFKPVASFMPSARITPCTRGQTSASIPIVLPHSRVGHPRRGRPDHFLSVAHVHVVVHHDDELRVHGLAQQTPDAEPLVQRHPEDRRFVGWLASDAQRLAVGPYECAVSRDRWPGSSAFGSNGSWSRSIFDEITRARAVLKSALCRFPFGVRASSRIRSLSPFLTVKREASRRRVLSG